MRYLPLLLLIACSPVHTGWVVINATPEQEADAQDIVKVTRDVTGAALERGAISLTTTPYGLDGIDRKSVV